MDNFNNVYSENNLVCESACDSRTVKAFYATNVGNVRAENEDNFYVEDNETRVSQNQSGETELCTDDRYIFAVCDGMGGESYGSEASRIAVETLSYFSEKIKSVDGTELSDAVNMYANEANNQICDMAREKKCTRSGSTLAMVCVDGANAYVFNIGDSRVYYFDGGSLVQVTEDQTLAMKKMKANIYTEEEAKNSPDAHKITSFLGMEARGIAITALSYEPITVNGQGVFLLCSDGLTDMCTDDEIKEILMTSSENVAQSLVNRALKNGGEDNVTCIAVCFC